MPTDQTEKTYPARTMNRPELHDEPVREDVIVGGPTEKAKPAEYKEPTDKQHEKLAEVAAGDTRQDPKVFSARIVDNAYMKLCVDGTDFKLYPDEVHQLSNVIAGAAIELPR